MQDPKPALQAAKKKKFEQAKAAGEGLEGLVDWTNLVISESSEERKVKMSCLISRFAVHMCKRASNAQEETLPSLEVLGGKRSRPFGLDEEVQIDPTVITVDSPE